MIAASESDPFMKGLRRDPLPEESATQRKLERLKKNVKIEKADPVSCRCRVVL